MSQSSVDIKIDHDQLVDSNDVLNDLQCKEINRLKVLQSLLNLSSKKLCGSWKPVLLELLKIISSCNIIRDQQSLLASQAFFTICAETSSSLSADIDAKQLFRDILKSEKNSCHDICDLHNIIDLESFKLTIIHGYLVVNNEIIFTEENFINSFDFIQQYCMNYTKYGYFAFNCLKIWLQNSVRMQFWNNNNCKVIEKKLGTIIFSNWDSCISDIAKINSSKLFPIYLNIMNDKYHGYLQRSFEIANEYLSWLTTNKFIILSEICKVWNGLPKFTTWEINIIISSLTKSHLKHASTKLYIALLNKMSAHEWKSVFGDAICLICKTWEDANEINALQLLWELWMKPTFNKLLKDNSVIILDLWSHFFTNNMTVCQSYLARMISELQFPKELNAMIISDYRVNIIPIYFTGDFVDYNRILSPIVDIRECVRLNTLALFCCSSNCLRDTDTAKDTFEIIKQFIYYNANTNSTRMRKGIFDNIKILFTQIVKLPWRKEIVQFILWLHKFIFYCFEPGSCYQRKVIGLKLYEILLTSTKMIIVNRELLKLDKSVEKRLKNHKIVNLSIKILMQCEGNWILDYPDSLCILLKLCIDPVEDIRQISSQLITDHFDIRILSNEDIIDITLKAEKFMRSSKFYELSAGVNLLLLISRIPHDANKYYHENPLNLYKLFLEDVQNSIIFVKTDFLEALTQRSKFNGTLLALLQLTLRENSSNSMLIDAEDYIESLLDLLEDAAVYFLSVLSPKSSTGTISYSSSFSEMAVAIEEVIRTSAVATQSNNTTVSPAHQIIMSNTWMALKTICELSSKMSTLPLQKDTIKRFVDLIISVLMKCRHKGAIEAAGSALSMSMRCLTQKNDFDDFFDAYLDKLLSLDLNDNINLTRRGAGLSIMFHKMVVSDVKRRLLHSALYKILVSLDSNEINLEKLHLSNNECIDVKQDSPRARLLHFLRTIVIDKNLHADLTIYMGKISIISFHYVQSSEWAIRNASLQLLGAVISRLTGQSAENNKDLHAFGTGYSINNFVTHYPTLAQLVLDNIKHVDTYDYKSTNIYVPILTLISKMTIGGCYLTDILSQNYVDTLKKCLKSLFGHPVDHVRCLAAKAYAAMTTVQCLISELYLLETECVENHNYNYIHGYLLAQNCLQTLINNSLISVHKELLTNDSKMVLKHIYNCKISRLRKLINDWKNTDGNRRSPCNIIDATFIRSLEFWECLDFDRFSMSVTPSDLTKIVIDCYNNKANKGIIYGLCELIDELLKYHCYENDVNYMDVKKIFGNFTLESQSTEDIEQSLTKYFAFISFLSKLKTYKDGNHDSSAEDCESLSHNIDCYKSALRGLLFTILTLSSDSELYEFTHYILLLFLQSKNAFTSEIGREIYFFNIDKIKTSKIKNNQNINFKLLSFLMFFISNSQSAFDYDVMHELIIDDYINVIYNTRKEKKIFLIDYLMQIISISNSVHTAQSKIFELMIRLLTEENDEIRDKLCEKFKDFIAGDIHGESSEIIDTLFDRYEDKKKPLEINIIPISEYYLHQWMSRKVFYNDKCLTSGCSVKCQLLSVDSFIEEIEKNNINNCLESPFDHDETYREITKLINIHYCCLLTCKKKAKELRLRNTGFPIKYDEVINVGKQFYTAYCNAKREEAEENETNEIKKAKSIVNIILNINLTEYLKYKQAKLGILSIYPWFF